MRITTLSSSVKMKMFAFTKTNSAFEVKIPEQTSSHTEVGIAEDKVELSYCLLIPLSAISYCLPISHLPISYLLFFFVPGGIFARDYGIAAVCSL